MTLEELKGYDEETVSEDTFEELKKSAEVVDWDYEGKVVILFLSDDTEIRVTVEEEEEEYDDDNEKAPGMWSKEYYAYVGMREEDFF